MDSLSNAGSYALVLACPDPARIAVGSLGEVQLRAGYLVYVGSAFGSGGLAGRLRHHLRPVRRPHWHIDYVRRHASLVGVWCASGPRHLEHIWAASFASAPGFTVPHPRLGSADCACSAHLVHSPRRPIGRWIRDRLEGAHRGIRVDFFRPAQLQRKVAA